MTLYEELVARGLIAQVTNEEEISRLINEGKATFYIGFDPTADSLHVGHFMALCLMKRLQMGGNKPIAPMLINGENYADWLWLKLSDMFVITSLLMLVAGIGAVCFGATRYIRKKN